MTHSETQLRFLATQKSGEVSALLVRPERAQWLLVLGHGAGAGMRHAFMHNISDQLAERTIATFRYNFPYMEQGNRRPDPAPVLLATVGKAIEAASEAAGDLPLLAGGKSMGGRLTSLAAAETDLPFVRGLVFFGFPLHPAGQPSTSRGEHLAKVKPPMLFLQGTRDKLADLTLLRPICAQLGKRADLHIVEAADHSFHVPKSSGRDDSQVLAELGDTVLSWASRLDDVKIQQALCQMG
jgi:predicted alpha/beta-hydrolase family hydrolase